MLHLIHPAFVHFSVAFIIVGGVCEVVGLSCKRPALARWGSPLILIGLASLIPTIASGYLAANTVEVPAAAGELLGSHERNGWILLGLLFLSQFWKAWCGGRLPPKQEWLYVALMAITVLLAIYGAWLGGRMVYGHGVGLL